jgi:hypothetical protein
MSGGNAPNNGVASRYAFILYSATHIGLQGVDQTGWALVVSFRSCLVQYCSVFVVGGGETGSNSPPIPTLEILSRFPGDASSCLSAFARALKLYVCSAQIVSTRRDGMTGMA